MIPCYDLHCWEGTSEHSSLATCLLTGRQFCVPATSEHSWRGWEIIVRNVGNFSFFFIFYLLTTILLRDALTDLPGHCAALLCRNSGALLSRHLLTLSLRRLLADLPLYRLAGLLGNLLTLGGRNLPADIPLGGNVSNENQTTLRLTDWHPPGLAGRLLLAPMCSWAC